MFPWKQFFPSDSWREKLSAKFAKLTLPATPEASCAEGSGLAGPSGLSREQALWRFGVEPSGEPAFQAWSAAQRAARRSRGDPEGLEEDSD